LEMHGLMNYFTGWPRTMILPISASQVARIISSESPVPSWLVIYWQYLVNTYRLFCFVLFLKQSLAMLSRLIELLGSSDLPANCWYYRHALGHGSFIFSLSPPSPSLSLSLSLPPSPPSLPSFCLYLSLFFLTILEFELRALYLLGRHSSLNWLWILSHSQSPRKNSKRFILSAH
jgi:hypothetical protein